MHNSSRAMTACGAWIVLIPAMQAILSLMVNRWFIPIYGWEAPLKSALMPSYLEVFHPAVNGLMASLTIADAHQFLNAWHMILRIVSVGIHYSSIVVGVGLLRAKRWPRFVFTITAGTVLLLVFQAMFHDISRSSIGATLLMHDGALLLIWGIPLALLYCHPALRGHFSRNA